MRVAKNNLIQFCKTFLHSHAAAVAADDAAIVNRKLEERANLS